MGDDVGLDVAGTDARSESVEDGPFSPRSMREDPTTGTAMTLSPAGW
jgi:hypothetical protein